MTARRGYPPSVTITPRGHKLKESTHGDHVFVEAETADRCDIGLVLGTTITARIRPIEGAPGNLQAGRDPATASTDREIGIRWKREKIVGAEEIAAMWQTMDQSRA
jgi:hypothetical protein